MEGPVGLLYRDVGGKLHVDSEAMARPEDRVVIYLESIPDDESRPRRVVLDNITRALAFDGWTVTLSPDGE
jgi:hypothetical protein